MPGRRTMLDLSHGHLALLTRADAASLTSLVALTDATPPHCQCVWCFPGCAHWRGKRGAAVGVRLLKTWVPCALVSRRPERRTSPISPATPTSSESQRRQSLFLSHRGGVDTLLPAWAAASGDVAVHARLLEWVPKWWERDATMPREPTTGDDALLTAIQDARKRCCGAGVQLTSQAVQAALEEVDVRLRRRTFLLLVDTLVPFTDNHVYVLSI
ncbi:hypothetical protein NQL31_005103 [Lotmaria passim]